MVVLIAWDTSLHTQGGFKAAALVPGLVTLSLPLCVSVMWIQAKMLLPRALGGLGNETHPNHQYSLPTRDWSDAEIPPLSQPQQTDHSSKHPGHKQGQLPAARLPL